MSEVPFSRRHGLSGPPAGSLIRDDAPNSVRTKLVDLLSSLQLNSFGEDFDGVRLRNLCCEVLNVRPPSGALRGYVAFNDAQQLIYECEWFHFYGIVEELSQLLRNEDRRAAQFARAPQKDARFADSMNDAFVKWGVGWQLVDGKIVTRGGEAFESTVKTAVAVLEVDDKPTAASHLRFAISALSARPKANTSGAVAHATSAVECVLGEITGETMTLGKYLDKYPDLVHPALKKGVNGIYGYASDEGARHGKEGTEPAREEAEFVVATCAAVCTLLVGKNPK